MHKPAWLDEEGELFGLLSSYVDDLDKRPFSERKQALRKTVNKKTLPGLYRHNEDSDQKWTLLKSLANEYRIFDIMYDKRRGPYAAEFENASLILLEKAEPLVRRWLNRPVKLPYRHEWNEAARLHAKYFADGGEELSKRALKVEGLSAEEVILGFVELSKYISKGMSLRQLSARCFYGDSKFLDSRQDLVEKIFPHSMIRPRPVVVNAYLPSDFEDVLFVENQDSYIELALRGKLNCAIVYMAGFRSSARNIRDRNGVSLHFHVASVEKEKEAFKRWWYDEDVQMRSIWFWGDLDFSGMGILKALKQRFADAEAWRPGYQALLQCLVHGLGHKAVTASKDEQVDPGETGCQFTDQELLPALRKYERFVDQEGVLLDTL